MESVKRDPRGQGARGEFSAAMWFGSHGATVCIPLCHTPRDYDFIVDWGAGVHRVQVKTSTQVRKGRWEVTVCTRGGNRSWGGVVKRLDPARYEYLFVVVADGRRWLIPSSEVDGGSGIRLGGPKYERFEIEAGEPLVNSAPSLD
jgi:PD-(D/E)XK endonuclease